MNKKFQDYYQKNRLRVEELIKKVVKIDQVDNIDFREDEIMLNRIENSSFLLKDKKISILTSLLKKFFQLMEKDKYLFYEYKYNLLDCMTDMLKALHTSEKQIKRAQTSIKEYDKLDNHILFFENILTKLNENKKYYYIKITLDKSKPLFFLTRKVFLDFMMQYGNPYNYTPQELTNEDYDYFILDFKLNIEPEGFEEIVKSFDDEAVKDVKILNINDFKSVYNIKFYYKENKNKIPDEISKNFKVIENVCYYNLVDTYVLEDDEVKISDTLFNKELGELELVTFKKFNEKETRILILLDLKKENLNKIKQRIREVILDKDVRDILFKGKYDFYGLQFLEYLKENYNIEYGGY